MGSKIDQLKRNAIAAKFSGWLETVVIATPRVEDITARIHELRLTPAEVVTILHVMSANLCDQVRENRQRGDARFEAARILDIASDDVYEIIK